jgi:2-polyprenyl-3-methyl-5-hydroxy-6-metoxy-1,4-benzoquinol methylase
MANHQDDLDILWTSGNRLSMEQNNRTGADDNVRVRAWAEVREPLELQLAPLGQRALEALAARPGENVLDIGCGGGTTCATNSRL